MAYLEWSNDLDVGVHAMNDEHKELIDRMNRFAELAQKGARAQAASALKALGDYTVEHFRDEEAVMERMGFPERANHKRIHERLLAQFGEHAESYAKTGEYAEFLTFLKVWLKAHIKGIDIKYGRHASKVA